MDSRRVLTSVYVPPKKEKKPEPRSEVSSKEEKAVITPAQVPLIMNGNPVIFVFGLSLSTPRAHISKFFSEFGDVTDCDLPLDAPGVNKGYCYVRFSSVKSVIAVMQQKVLRSSCSPIIENVDVRSKREKNKDKKKEKEGIRKEMAEAAAADFKKRNDELRSKILAKRAEMGCALSDEQKALIKADPVVVLEGPGVQAGVKEMKIIAQKYGPVRHVHLPRDKYLKDKGLAYVHFSQASHALKLLEKPYIDIDGACVEVRPVQSEEEKVESHEDERSGHEVNADEYKIYVDNLHGSVVAKEVYGHFAVYGAVTNVDLPRARKKRSRLCNRGFAFVTFANKESMESALAAPEHKIKFKPVNVCLSNPNCSRKRKLEEPTATNEQPCDKKARRQSKKALQKQSLQGDAPSDQDSGVSASESEDDEDLLSSEGEE
ncbi:RNA recognition motif domain [Trinorchestia longiramus]|nr:RNA recognition motif domain [Trinorchestia longiramus]